MNPQGADSSHSNPQPSNSSPKPQGSILATLVKAWRWIWDFPWFTAAKVASVVALALLVTVALILGFGLMVAGLLGWV